MAVVLPNGVRKQAFQAFCRAIMNDPILRREVKQWRLWDGKHANTEPTVDQMPCVQLRIVGGPIEPYASDGDLPSDVDWLTRPAILIDLWVAGTDAGVMMDLHDVLDNALYPQDEGAMAALQEKMWEVGIMSWQPAQDVLPRSDSDYSAQSIHGQGRYQLNLVVGQ